MLENYRKFKTHHTLPLNMSKRFCWMSNIFCECNNIGVTLQLFCNVRSKHNLRWMSQLPPVSELVRKSSIFRPYKFILSIKVFVFFVSIQQIICYLSRYCRSIILSLRSALFCASWVNTLRSGRTRIYLQCLWGDIQCVHIDFWKSCKTCYGTCVKIKSQINFIAKNNLHKINRVS